MTLDSEDLSQPKRLVRGKRRRSLTTLQLSQPKNNTRRSEDRPHEPLDRRYVTLLDEDDPQRGDSPREYVWLSLGRPSPIGVTSLLYVRFGRRNADEEWRKQTSSFLFNIKPFLLSVKKKKDTLQGGV